MLEGWTLVIVSAAAIAATILLGRENPWAWGTLAAVLMVLGLHALGAAALFLGVIMLLHRISRQPGRE